MYESIRVCNASSIFSLPCDKMTADKISAADDSCEGRLSLLHTLLRTLPKGEEEHLDHKWSLCGFRYRPVAHAFMECKEETSCAIDWRGKGSGCHHSVFKACIRKHKLCAVLVWTKLIHELVYVTTNI
jgi:hypothetical protein